MTEDSESSPGRDRRLLVAVAIGGFIFVNIVIVWWWTRSRGPVGGRDEGTFASTELATAVARCANAIGSLPPSAGPTGTLADATSGYTMTGSELLPKDARCTAASLPWKHHWIYQWQANADAHGGQILGRTDRNGDGIVDDQLTATVACTSAPFHCAEPGQRSEHTGDPNP